MSGKIRKIFTDPSGNFMEWMTLFNPALISKFPNLSDEAQNKLMYLYSLSLKADSTVEQCIQNVEKFAFEYDALSNKLSEHLQILLIDDNTEFTDETDKNLQDLETVTIKGNVGDGSDIGSASTLAVAVLRKTAFVRKKVSLVKNTQTIRRDNERLTQVTQYYEREFKRAAEDVSRVQASLQREIDQTMDQAALLRLNKTMTKIRSDLDEIGVSRNISTQVILETYEKYVTTEKEITLLKGKLKKYGDLPPSINEAMQIIEDTKRQLALVVDDFKKKLTSYHIRPV